MQLNSILYMLLQYALVYFQFSASTKKFYLLFYNRVLPTSVNVCICYCKTTVYGTMLISRLSCKILSLLNLVDKSFKYFAILMHLINLRLSNRDIVKIILDIYQNNKFYRNIYDILIRENVSANEFMCHFRFISDVTFSIL